jgi:lipid-A-disaccharide synthase
MVNELRENLTIHLIDDLGAEGAVGPTAGGARAALFHARASVVASGTATVEAALIGNPFVVVYRVSPLTYAIAKRVVTVPHVAMANLIAGKRLGPELIQNDFTASNLVQELERLLPDGAARESMMQELLAIRRLLRPRQLSVSGAGGAIERVAAVTLNEMQTASPVQNELTVQS